ncbi:MAG: electron transfer flavoprotein subunit alpha/FixB family protein, partial [Planctomycetota bacterium]
MNTHKGVMVYCEVVDGKLAEISTELLGCGRKLADDLEEPLSAMFVGSGISDSANEAIAFGADKVYVVDDPLLEDYRTDSYVAAMEKLAGQAMPQIVLMGQTSIGRDLAPALAFRLDTAATMDCVDLEIDPDSKRLLQTKPVYGGNAQAIYTTEYN